MPERSLKQHAREHFSKVNKRPKWEDGPPRCGDLSNRAAGEVSEEALAALDQAQAEDAPPADKWNR